MDFFVKALQQNPELAILLALAVGFAIGINTGARPIMHKEISAS